MIDTILHIIDVMKPGGRSEYLRPLLKITEATKRRGIIVLISDFYDEPRAELGTHLKLPPWLEGQRADIERAVPPFTLKAVEQEGKDG